MIHNSRSTTYIFAAAILALAAGAACRTPEVRQPQVQAQAAIQAPKPDPEAAVTVSKKTYYLGKDGSQESFKAFSEFADRAYVRVCENNPQYQHDVTGFIYSLAPVGAIRVMSEVEVSCITRQKFAATAGQKICADFLNEISRKY